MSPDQSQIELIQKDLDKYTSLDTLAQQEGGKLLIESLLADIVATVDRLSVSSRNMGHEEMISVCATLGANMSLLRTLTRAEKNKEGAKAALEAALKE